MKSTPHKRLLLRDIDVLATMDDQGTELRNAYVVVEDGWITEVGRGNPPAPTPDLEVLPCGGLIATPGLINTHHHLFQTLTRVLPAAQNSRILEWMGFNYPYWRQIDEEAVYATALVGLGELALSGCTTSSDHLYAFPEAAGPSLALLGAEIRAARELGMRFAPTRGAVDVSLEAGGSPPPDLVQDTDQVLADMEAAAAAFHDPSPGSMCQVGLAPNSMTICSERLLVEAGALARRLGLRRHTHVAEVLEEEAYSLQRWGVRPLRRLEDLGWLGPDVWLAHVVHVNSEEIAALARTHTSVAHCPTSNMRLASGAAPILEMLDAGVQVSLGVDGSASNDSGHLLGEARQALLLSRLRERTRLMSARTAIRLATRGGAAALGRTDIGQLTPGSQADIALWPRDGVAAAGTENDPVAGLVLAWPRAVRHLVVQGRLIVKAGALTGVDEQLAVALHDAAMSRVVAAGS